MRDRAGRHAKRGCCAVNFSGESRMTMMQMSSRILGVVVAAFVAPLVVQPSDALAAACGKQAKGARCDTHTFGGPGGGSFRAECPKNHYLNGIVTKAGSYVDRIWGRCFPFASGNKVQTEQFGGTGGAIEPAECPNAREVNRIVVFVAPEGFVRNIQVFCDGQAAPECTGYGDGECVNPQGDQASRLMECPDGMAVVGLKGKHGKLVDRLGLVCGPAGAAESPALGPTAGFKAFCESHASAAFQVAIEAAKRPECGLTGARWSTNKKAHMDWCLGLNGNEAAANAETAARSQGLSSCVAQVKANQNLPPPLSPGTLLGVWDTKTGDGQSYTLLVLPQGDTLSVAVGAADKTLDGSIQASFFLEHKRMNFVLTQPGIGATSRGSIQLTDDNNFSGTMTKDGGGQSSWTGKRRN